MMLTTEHEIQSKYSGKEVAAGYVEQRFVAPLMALLHDRQVAAVNRVMREQRPQRSLEIAPGPGRLTRDVVPTGQLVCMEFNQGMIERGRASSQGKAAWVRGNGFKLPIASGFDFVYTFRFIRHFQEADRKRLYAEIHRVLRPGGIFIMDAVNERVSKPLREARPEDYRVHDELYRPDELKLELCNAGFEPPSLAPVQKCFGLQFRSQVIIGPRANWLNRLIIRGLEKLPVRDGLEWIVTCRRA
jgi:SAM-dependent methyltransferase